jgi:predicted Fe-Mo cluster-binding NifX family protein
MRIAIPSDGEGGLDGVRAGHFGHCDCFTVVDAEDGKITGVATVANPPHVQGGCMAPVNLLAGHQVNAMIVGGIGMRPLMGFRQVGISVYHEAQTREIRPVIEKMLAGQVPEIRDDLVCGGGH